MHSGLLTQAETLDMSANAKTDLATKQRDPQHDPDWEEFAAEFLIRPDTTYLNHGSFGPPSQRVRNARRQWINTLDSQPMDFYVRKFEPALDYARKTTANFFGTEPANFVFVENATFGMNTVADSFPLEPGDEILTNNHEYGAVNRIWNRRAERSGAVVKTAQLPEFIESKQQVIDSLLKEVTDKTRLLVVSCITSSTALIMPIAEICKAFHERGVAVCVDGPHAPAQIDLQLDDLDCDFFASSCHKWLSATLGTGFLYVNPKWHHIVQPQLQSWGRVMPAKPETWDDEFTWSGTRDPSGYLSVPAAIEFLTDVGLENFRARSRYLAATAEEMLCKQFGTKPIASRADGWYGSMALVPMPDGDWSELQKSIYEEYKIEFRVIRFDEKWFVRVACHLYNNTKHLETLCNALKKQMMT